MAYTFNGGVRLDEHKNTEGCAIEIMPAPATVSIPLSQHIGIPATEVVKVGDTVYKGQIIGNIPTGLGCPVHSSVSGKVTAIVEKDSTRGKRVKHIVIENDFQDTFDPEIKPWDKKLADTTPEEIAGVIRNAGIAGMGGATFPTYAKINSAIGKVERIIVNCAECEPYITANHRRLLEMPDNVIGGLKILMKALSVRTGEIAVEDNKMDAVEVLKEHITDPELIKIKILKTKYPQGDERQLIFALTGKELPSGKFPADVGCMVVNAETCSAIYRAFAKGKPLTERVVTVDGDCIATPKNVLVPIGTSYSALIEFCGGLVKEPKKIINGGPMMGSAVWDIDDPVTKGTSAVLVFSEEYEKEHDVEGTCIRCGRCVKVCPMRLMPSYFANFVQNGRTELAEEYDIMSCVECGSCTYICPGHVPIVHYVRKAKGMIADRKLTEAKAKEKSAKKD